MPCFFDFFGKGEGDERHGKSYCCSRGGDDGIQSEEDIKDRQTAKRIVGIRLKKGLI